MSSSSSGLAHLLGLLPPLDRHRLLLVVGADVCLRLQCSSKALFQLIASDGELWRHLYHLTYLVEDEKEAECLDMLRTHLQPAAPLSIWSTTWWQRAFQRRARLDDRWRQGACRLRQIPLPTLASGTIMHPCINYGTWMVVRTTDHRLFLRDIYDDDNASSLAVSGEACTADLARLQDWTELPLCDTWHGSTCGLLLGTSVNAQSIVTIAVYGARHVLHAWETRTGRLICRLPVDNGCLEQLCWSYAVVRKPSTTTRGPQELTIDLRTGFVYRIEEALRDTHWHLQHTDKHGLYAYSATETNGIISWSLLLFPGGSSQAASTASASPITACIPGSPPRVIKSGQLKLLSNQHRLKSTRRIDRRRILVSMTFFDSDVTSHVGVQDIDSADTLIAWSYAISGRAAWPILSEQVLLVFGPVCSVLCIETGYTFTTLSNQHSIGLKRAIGATVGEGDSSEMGTVMLSSLDTGKPMYSLVNRHISLDYLRQYVDVNAGYVLQSFCEDSQLYVWDFMTPTRDQVDEPATLWAVEQPSPTLPASMKL